MQRRTVLQRGLGALAVTVSLAGCGGGGDTDGGDDENGGDTDSSDGDGGGMDGVSETGKSGLTRSWTNIVDARDEFDPDPVELVAIEEQSVTDTGVTLEFTVQNNADREAPLADYAWTILLFESDEPPAGDELTTADHLPDTGTAPEYAGGDAPDPVPPDETGSIAYGVELTDDAEASVGSYGVIFGCPGVGEPPGCG